MLPVAGSRKQTSELPMQKAPRRTCCASTMAAKSVARLLTILPAVVMGVEAPPIGRGPVLAATPGRHLDHDPERGRLLAQILERLDGVGGHDRELLDLAVNVRACDVLAGDAH